MEYAHTSSRKYRMACLHNKWIVNWMHGMETGRLTSNRASPLCVFMCVRAWHSQAGRSCYSWNTVLDWIINETSYIYMYIHTWDSRIVGSISFICDSVLHSIRSLLIIKLCSFTPNQSNTSKTLHDENEWD